MTGQLTGQRARESFCSASLLVKTAEHGALDIGLDGGGQDRKKLSITETSVVYESNSLEYMPPLSFLPNSALTHYYAIQGRCVGPFQNMAQLKQ